MIGVAGEVAFLDKILCAIAPIAPTVKITTATLPIFGIALKRVVIGWKLNGIRLVIGDVAELMIVTAFPQIVPTPENALLNNPVKPENKLEPEFVIVVISPPKILGF